jgi:hypothetical protein
MVPDSLTLSSASRHRAGPDGVLPHGAAGVATASQRLGGLLVPLTTLTTASWLLRVAAVEGTLRPAHALGAAALLVLDLEVGLSLLAGRAKVHAWAVFRVAAGCAVVALLLVAGRIPPLVATLWLGGSAAALLLLAGQGEAGTARRWGAGGLLGAHLFAWVVLVLLPFTPTGLPAARPPPLEVHGPGDDWQLRFPAGRWRAVEPPPGVDRLAVREGGTATLHLLAVQTPDPRPEAVEDGLLATLRAEGWATVVGRGGVGGGGRLLRIRMEPRPGRSGRPLELALAQYRRGELHVLAVAMAEALAWPEVEGEVLAALDSFTTERRVVPRSAEWAAVQPAPSVSRPGAGP